MLIYIDYDKNLFSEKEVEYLTWEFQLIIENTSKVENNVPTYASTYEVSINVYPVEIFVKISRHHFEKRENYTENLKQAFTCWKKESNFSHKINLTVIPMDWELALDI